MLDVRYGTAARSHENTFFRKFAQSLKRYFDSHNIEGLLLGFPICLVREDLQIDALLITDRTITVIDFKDYSGRLTLPSESNFKKGTWRMSDGLIVKGGSSPNPFYQLGLQRERLAGILRMTAKNLTKFNPQHISTVVCFTEPVEVDGLIPGKFKLSFFIANSESYVEKLFDIINVEEDSDDLLSKNFLDYVNKKLFETSPYDCFITPSSNEDCANEATCDIVENSTAAREPDIWDQVMRFMNGEDDVLLITGTIGSGKHSLAERLRESAHSAGFVSARLFALSNRVKNNLMNTMEEVESLYSTIYDFSKKEIDEQTGKEIIPLASFSPTDAFSDIEPRKDAEELRSIFIIYESQMVTNSYRDEGTVRFGSGELLKDVLDYLGIGSSKENKVIFVGDKFQLSFGSWSQSSLNPSSYHDDISICTLDLPDTEDPDGIERVCLEIADRIRSEGFSELVIAPNEAVALRPRKSERALVEEVARNWSTHKIIAYSNKRSFDLNSYIMRNIIQNGSQLAGGDLVIFNNQILAYPIEAGSADQVLAFNAGEPIRIENGTFGVIQRIVNPTLFRSFSFRGLSDPVKLSLVRVEVQLETGASVSVEILSEYLYSEKAGLSNYEEQAMQIILKELIAEAEQSHPFGPGDPDFDEMIRKAEETGVKEYVVTERGLYRDASDARRLTTYEQRHRGKIAKRLASDPNSDYFRWLNAARVKFGWCMTVHKAMSYKWPHVVFATTYDQGRNNREYFKFVYTGLSRASENVSLVKWENLSPFSETTFVSEPMGTGKKKKAIIAEAGAGTPRTVVERLLNSALEDGMEIISIESKNYLELAHIQHGEAQATIGFDYTGKREIRSPRLINGDARLFETISSKIAPSETALSASSLVFHTCNLDGKF
ncbi:NERD domain-containing protein [Parvibacter caecicola]|uniref:NERD domain-containing protein n=1 Tax=Parvibacter caecicola TaxID=747645 RepID=UPI002730FEA8|nr:NERD domain-containing protein [Parvibacter caecicola]